MKTAEFFSCGFLKDTQIVVADSLVDEVVKMLLEFALYCNDLDIFCHRESYVVFIVTVVLIHK